MFMVHNSDDQQPSSHDAAMPEVPATVIWGTNVNVNETIEKYVIFLLCEDIYLLLLVVTSFHRFPVPLFLLYENPLMSIC